MTFDVPCVIVTLNAKCKLFASIVKRMVGEKINNVV